MFNISCRPKVSPTTGTDHQVAAADPSAAGSRGGWLELERSLLLWALQGWEAFSAGPAGDAAGGWEALKAAAAAAKSPAARPREFTLHFNGTQCSLFFIRFKGSCSQWSLNFLAALRHVNGQLLHGKPVGGRCRDVDRAWRSGEQRRQWRLVGRHGHVGRGCEEPVWPARQLEQQHGLEEQPQQPLTEVHWTRAPTHFLTDQIDGQCHESCLSSPVSSTWCGARGRRTKRSCWSCFRAWSPRTASPPGVNRCCTLSTPLPTTPPPLWMVGCRTFGRSVRCIVCAKIWHIDIGFYVFSIANPLSFVYSSFFLFFCKVATIVAYLKEVESPYAVLDFIRSYLGDTVEAKEFAKQFLERRAKQKANQQRQQQQVSWSWKSMSHKHVSLQTAVSSQVNLRPWET